MILQLTDQKSLESNGLQPVSLEIVRKGAISRSGITLEFLSNKQILVTVSLDGESECILLTLEPRLPQESTRAEMESTGFAFLFENIDAPIEQASRWPLSSIIKDDDNNIFYRLTNTFHDDYDEEPKRHLGGDEIKFSIYRTDHGEGIAVIENGTNLYNQSGVINYYSFRTIPPSEVNRINTK